MNGQVKAGIGEHNSGNILENIHLTQFTTLLFELLGHYCKLSSYIYILHKINCIKSLYFNYVYIKHKMFSQETDSKSDAEQGRQEPSSPTHPQTRECLNNPGDFLFYLKLHFPPLKQEKKEGAKISLCRTSGFHPGEPCSLALPL